MYRVYFTNFQYYSQSTGNTLEEAIEIARKAGFECSIVLNEEIVVTWSILSGTRIIRK